MQNSNLLFGIRNASKKNMMNVPNSWREQLSLLKVWEEKKGVGENLPKNLR